MWNFLAKITNFSRGNIIPYLKKLASLRPIGHYAQRIFKDWNNWRNSYFTQTIAHC